MKSASFANFQVGMVDDPSVEDQGGFEFAAGMDIFSEKGVIKPGFKLEEVPLDTGVTLDALPTHMVRNKNEAGANSYFAVGDKILKQPTGNAIEDFATNALGTIDGLGAWVNDIVYTKGNNLGRINIGGSGQDDSFATLSSESSRAHPIIDQAGTLKIGNRQYVDSLDESFTLRTQALKLPRYAEAVSLADYQNDVFVGGSMQYNASMNIATNEATVYRWNGIPFSTGSALPTSVYRSEKFIARAQVSANRTLWALPAEDYAIYYFDGAGFALFKRFSTDFLDTLRPNHESVCEYKEGFLFTGDSTRAPGVFHFQEGALCQSFIFPDTISSDVEAGFVKLGYNNKVYVGIKDNDDDSCYILRETVYRQNQAYMATLWHRIGTDQNKRWRGVKLNLKPLPDNCGVRIYYRTQRNASFTDSGIVVGLGQYNQDRPLIFSAQPRSREIQFKFVFTTPVLEVPGNVDVCPELLSYDVLFDRINSFSS